MQCISTPLSEDELLAAMSDVAEADVQEHLEQCDFCKTRLARLEQAEGKLKRHLYRWDCPDADTLGEFVLNMLPETALADIAAHVRQCPRCQQDVVEAHQFFEQIDQAEARETERLSQRSRKRPIITGPVLLPQFGAQPAAALRGGTIEPFEFEGVTVYLSVFQAAGSYQLDGQLTGVDAARWRKSLVKAQQGETRPALGVINDRGKFQCHLKTQDAFDLTITRQDGTNIIIEGIKIAPG